MDFKKNFTAKCLIIIFIILIFLIVFLLIFKAGEFVGYRKAIFSYRWADNYHRNFGGPDRGIFRDLSGRDYIGAHGSAGSIIKIDNNTIVIKGKDDVEKNILVGDATTIREQNQSIKIADLKVDDKIIVIGSPNDQGQIEAKFIRVLL